MRLDAPEGSINIFNMLRLRMGVTATLLEGSPSLRLFMDLLPRHFIIWARFLALQAGLPR